MAKTPIRKERAGKYVVVLVTCGSRAEAQRIAREIVSQRLAACANLLETPVRSVYRWKGKVENAREFLLLIKTSAKRLAALQAEVKRLHSHIDTGRVQAARRTRVHRPANHRGLAGLFEVA